METQDKEVQEVEAVPETQEEEVAVEEEQPEEEPEVKSKPKPYDNGLGLSDELPKPKLFDQPDGLL